MSDGDMASLAGRELWPSEVIRRGPFIIQLPCDLPALLRTTEAAYIARALEVTGGNRKAAAKLLGLNRTTLHEKLRRAGYEIRPCRRR